MSNYLPGTAPSEMSPPVPTLPSAARSTEGPRLLAAFLSLILPGAGQFLIHRPRKGVLFLLAFPLLFLLIRPLALPRTIVGLGFLFLAFIVLCILAMVDAGYSGRPETRLRQVWLVLLLPLALVAGLQHGGWSMRAFGFRGLQMTTRSMAPTIPLGTRVFIDSFYYRHRNPKRGDIVAFSTPTAPRFTTVKRVIAVSGETIEVRRDAVLINGQAIQEPYALFQGPLADEIQRVGPVTLPPGKLFVMGDHRHLSLDSRMASFGLVDVSTLRGKVIYTVTLGAPVKTVD
jgi:signal peptidase I